MLRQAITPPGDGLLGRSANEIAGGLFIARAQNDRRLGSGRDVLLEAAADLHELRQTLHRNQECAVRFARRVQDLSEVAVAELRKIFEDDSEQRPIDLPPLLFA